MNALQAIEVLFEAFKELLTVSGVYLKEDFCFFHPVSRLHVAFVVLQFRGAQMDDYDFKVHTH